MIEELKNKDFAALEPLRATQKLSVIFSNGVEEGHLHILVQKPSMCVIRHLSPHLTESPLQISNQLSEGVWI